MTEAVFRYIREHPDSFSMFLCGCSKAYLARPFYVHNYLEFCAKSLADELEARELVMTLSKTTVPAEMNTFGMGRRFEDCRYKGTDTEHDVIPY